MNKLKIIGLSALCGSLTAFAASAGELTVSGGATVTWAKANKGTTGNPIGMNSGVSFAGSGELDNGWAISLGIDNADKSVYSAANLTLTTNSIGAFKIGTVGGAVGLASYDDKMPTAWEETWGTAVGTSVNLQKGSGSSTALQWTLPTVAGLTLAGTWAPKNDGVIVSDKGGSGGGVSNIGEGRDITININPVTGVNLFGGYSWTEKTNPSLKAGSNAEVNEDVEEGTVGLTVAFGPVEAGVQVAGEYLGARGATGNSEVGGYKNNMWGIAFNVNDNLSLSYGEFDSRKMWENQGSNESVEMHIESWQIAYSVGGASLKIADSEVEQAAYSTTASNDISGTTIALTLAF